MIVAKWLQDMPHDGWFNSMLDVIPASLSSLSVYLFTVILSNIGKNVPSRPHVWT